MSIRVYRRVGTRTTVSVGLFTAATAVFLLVLVALQVAAGAAVILTISALVEWWGRRRTRRRVDAGEERLV